MGNWPVEHPPREIQMKEYYHPAMFPEEIPRRLMKIFLYRGDVVLDLFNGARTTMLGAWKCGRRFIGIEISPQHCETAMQRITAVSKGEGEAGTSALALMYPD
jgi:site-specific DNA-methyltransferase (adenine-specific)